MWAIAIEKVDVEDNPSARWLQDVCNGGGLRMVKWRRKKVA
jgi:hypothetical protein